MEAKEGSTICYLIVIENSDSVRSETEPKQLRFGLEKLNIELEDAKMLCRAQTDTAE